MAELNVPKRMSRAERFAPKGGDFVPGAGQAREIAQEQASFIAELESVRVYGDWAVGMARTVDRKEVKVTGSSVKDLVEGASYVFRGAEKNHRVHGISFEVSSTSPYIAPNRRGLERYLERNFSGIGKAKAGEFVSQYLADFEDEDAGIESLRNKLLMEPWALDLTGVSKKAEFMGQKEGSAALEYVYRDFSTKLGGIPGMKDGILRPLAAYCIGETESQENAGLVAEKIKDAWEFLANDPYSAIAEVDGYGFAMADLIGRSLSIPADALPRLRALVAHAVEEGCGRAGHVYLYEGQVERAIHELDKTIDTSIAIKVALDSDMIVADRDDDETKYYTPSLLRAELGLARQIVRLCKSATPMTKAPREAVARKAQETAMAQWGYPLDASQLEALSGIMTSDKRIHTLTAGPGHGKSALMELLSMLLSKKEILFVGPTGKSAKVLSNRISKHGRSASTIHSAYAGADPDSFQVNKKNPIEDDVLVVDESSMVDVELMRAVLDGVGDHTHVILLGDKNQLPSVSPGAVLRDMLAISAIDRHELNTPHRSSGGILDLVGQVAAGDVSCENAAGVEFSGSLGDAGTDFNVVAQNYIAAVQEKGFENVVLLMSKRRGDAGIPGWNTTYANARLREACNPNAIKVPGTRLHIKDRIIVRKNLSVEDANGAEAQIVNGDTGSILSFEKHQDGRNAGAKSLMLGLDDGRLIVLPSSDIDVLQHSYAMTVHSAQGSEYKHVVAVVTAGAPAFINQAMLFTGLSRAKEVLQVFANDADVRKVAMTPLPWRNSRLVERVCKILGEDVPAQYKRQKGAVARDEDFQPSQPVVARKGSRADRFRPREDEWGMQDGGGDGAVDPSISDGDGDRSTHAVVAAAEPEVPVAQVVAVPAKLVPLLELSGRTRSWPPESYGRERAAQVYERFR